ncbi:MAG TPA: VCBS repeat-containing protein [Verrucomicrobiae bacterium]|nr:VCBS repeat-containing protein [Verrucomicrobiae bacterium]
MNNVRAYLILGRIVFFLFFAIGLGLPRLGSAADSMESGPGYRRLKLEPVGAGKDGFTLLQPDQTGVRFTNVLSRERALASQILPNGSGVAAGDVDGDGRCDLFFCGLKCGCKLYRNRGNWRFEDITDQAGVGLTNLDATGAALVDIDGDGDLDLIVNSLGGGTHVLLNDGRGHFTDSAQVLNQGFGGTSLALADYDGDGQLDLYIANYRLNTVNDDPNIRYSLRNVNGQLIVAAINGKPLTDPEWTNRFHFQIDQAKGKFAHEELGEPDGLYRNLGGGRFELVPFTGGAFQDEDGKPLSQPPFDWGLSVMFRDLNQDGRPDLYVCNDFNTPDRIWINQGKGIFRAVPRLAIRQTPLSSMAMDVADVNRDGWDDVFVVDMLSREHRRRLVQRVNLRPEVLAPGQIENRPQYSRNMLQLNRGDGTYAELAQFAGLEASEWSWSPIFLDVDLDGFEDLLVSTGLVRDNMNIDSLEAIQRMRGQAAGRTASAQLRTKFPPLATGALAFRSLGGTRFIEQSQLWGFDQRAISQGMCLADLDNDGDLDVIVNNMNEAAGIYRNDTAKPRLAVVLKGSTQNTHGIGARIRVYGGAVPLQSQEMISGGRYLSCDQAMRVFAAGSATNRLRIEVDWPAGHRSVVQNAEANYLYEIDEAGATAPTPPPTPRADTSFFEDVSKLLGHSHHEDPFDDFARQPTLSKRLSQLGPGVCWCDLNGDGWDDLVIGSGKGGQMAVFVNDRTGGFRAEKNSGLSTPVMRDQTAIVAWPRGTNAPVLLAGSANYEDGEPTGSAVQSFDPAAGKWGEAIAAGDASVGPLAVGDLDGDGNLDLFVGGRVKAGRYPEAASSRIFRNQNGTFVLDEANSRVLENVGMVSSALWSDLDGDGFPELIVACEWGPVRIFHNNHGRLSPWNPAVRFASTPGGMTLPKGDVSTLNELRGWWNGVTTGDLDGDGRLDIIASNWGENSKYQQHRAAPMRVYSADFNQEGVLGLFEAYYEPEMRKYVPERRLDVAARALPSLRSRFPTFQAYADAGIEEILGDWLPKTQVLEANCLESMVFMNQGASFAAKALPLEAQLAPAFAVVVADYDGDGCEDIFLSQNFFAVEPETSRYDAGRGLWLRGDGHGELRAVPGSESGVLVYGEQRGAAVADFDRDGRVDLVVTQNAAETRLFKNLKAKPGLRVRLKGPKGNPWGIGAQLRVKCGGQFGPAREIHGGGGYWSQDSVVQVLGCTGRPEQLWVRWPGGKTFTLDVPEGAAEIQIDIEGRLEVRQSR